MTDNTQPEAGSTHIIRYALEMGLLWIDGSARDKVRESLDALDTLEAQLEAIGAGGVSGPLMGRAVDHFPDVTKMASRWYMVNKDGMATLCTDKADAEREAADAQAISKAPDHIPEVGNMVAQAISAEPAGAGYAELPDAKTLGEAVAAWIGVETRGAHNWVDTTVGRLGFAVRSVVGDMLRASHGQAPAQTADFTTPVAWLDPWTGTKVTTDYDAYGKHGIPLYTAPQPVAREPLTPERLREIERMCVYANTATLIDFARAIERAHGIKGGQHAE